MPFTDELVATQTILAVLEEVLDIDSSFVFVDTPLTQQPVLSALSPLSMAAISVKLCYEYDVNFPCDAFSEEQTVSEMADIIVLHRAPVLRNRTQEMARFVA